MTSVLKNLSIVSKLILLGLVTSLVSLTLTFAVLIAHENSSYRGTAIRELNGLAQIIAINSTAALAFKDPATASQTLAAVASVGKIKSATLYSDDGKEFSEYRVGGKIGRADMEQIAGWRGHLIQSGLHENGGNLVTDRTITVLQPVMLKGDRVGYIQLCATMDELNVSLSRYLGLAAIIFLCAAALAALLSYVLQGLISGPIRRLNEAVGNVSKTQNFKVRVEATTRDEVGTLIRGFNDMLAQVERRDDELTAYRETLEAKITARTAELAASNRTLSKTVTDLEVAKDQAEASNRAKTEFLANMSHEIRTPMNGVLGVVELLDRSELTVKQRRYLQMIRSSGTQLLTLISEILDLSKIEAGQIDFESRPFNLRQLLEETVELFAPAAHAKGLELNTFVPASINTDVVGDSARLSQIVTNLVSNAIKFTSSGSILVRVVSEGSREGKSILRFEVHDTGIGIPANRQEQIFKAFVQADGSTTRKYGGTGLGLSICKQLCELMGGQIGVCSEPDKGTEFWFTLPIVPAAASQVARSPFKLLSGRPILLVADTPVGREILTDHIVSWGLSVVVVETATEAERAAEVAASKGSPFKYAVIDLAQNPLEAQALGHRLAERAGAEHIGAIVTTSHPSLKEDESSPVRILVKPLNRSDLYSCLAELISGQTRARDTAVNQAIGLDDDVKIAAKVLLVEDNPVNQEVAIDLLGQFGCMVEGANNGLEAVRRLKEGRYDIVFMDCQMPEMDGYEATRALREYERPLNRRTPVVALTANAMEDDRRLCLAAEMDDYMTKPVTRHQLGAMLVKWTGATKPTGVQEQTPVAVADAGSAIDTAVLAAMAAGSGDPARGARLVARVVRKYLESSPALVEAIKSSPSDFDTLARTAHTLKSSSAYVGALHLSELCKELERRARGGAPGALEQLISRIESVFAETCEALHTIEEQAA
jgi:signal transduction histidine kinase/CheY-like chemotaxis protein